MNKVNSFQIAKNSASGSCLAFGWFFANFSLVLLVKVLLARKACNNLVESKPFLYYRRKDALFHRLRLNTPKVQKYWFWTHWAPSEICSIRLSSTIVGDFARQYQEKFFDPWAQYLEISKMVRRVVMLHSESQLRHDTA